MNAGDQVPRARLNDVERLRDDCGDDQRDFGGVEEYGLRQAELGLPLPFPRFRATLFICVDVANTALVIAAMLVCAMFAPDLPLTDSLTVNPRP